jgi:hypothetical protein
MKSSRAYEIARQAIRDSLQDVIDEITDAAEQKNFECYIYREEKFSEAEEDILTREWGYTINFRYDASLDDKYIYTFSWETPNTDNSKE